MIDRLYFASSFRLGEWWAQHDERPPRTYVVISLHNLRNFRGFRDLPIHLCDKWWLMSNLSVVEEAMHYLRVAQVSGCTLIERSEAEHGIHRPYYIIPPRDISEKKTWTSQDYELMRILESQKTLLL